MVDCFFVVGVDCRCVRDDDCVVSVVFVWGIFGSGNVGDVDFN